MQQQNITNNCHSPWPVSVAVLGHGVPEHGPSLDDAPPAAGPVNHRRPQVHVIGRRQGRGGRQG